MAWSVRKLLDFSYTPAINEAFEGTWAHGDPPDASGQGSSDSEAVPSTQISGGATRGSDVTLNTDPDLPEEDAQPVSIAQTLAVQADLEHPREGSSLGCEAPDDGQRPWSTQAGTTLQQTRRATHQEGR